MLTLHLGSKIGSTLLEKLISKWINVRAYHFVRNWMQQYKWKQTKKGELVAEQGEPALRKGLSKKPKKKMISPKKKATFVIAASD